MTPALIIIKNDGCPTFAAFFVAKVGEQAARSECA
jgi:hypothetical protein